MDNKTALRTRAKEIRKKLDIQQLSLNAVEKLRMSDFYKKAENVLLFYPLKYEINLLELMCDNKKFYLPKVSGEHLFICPFSKDDTLEISKFNVKEPCSNPVNPEILDLIIVPALMADKKNYRLGYGGGFYDRFLAKYSDIKTVIPIANELIVEKLPREDFDVKCDFVINV